MDEIDGILEMVLSSPDNLCTQDELYQQRNQSLKCFEKADRDGNGCLTFDEISGLCEYMGIPMRGDEDEMLRKMDTDDSGTLEKSEWVRWWLNRISTMPNPEKQQEVMAGHTFTQFDVDLSGYIDAMEFRALVSELGADFSDNEIEEALHQLDSDQNGRVDRQEFVDWWVSRTKVTHSGGVVGLKLKKLASKAAKMFHTDIHTAAWRGQLDLVKLFVESDARLVLARDMEEYGAGFTPLHYAAYAGHLDMVKFLLTHGQQVGSEGGTKGKGKKVQHQTNDDGFTPLFYAAQRGHEEICRLLLQYDADPTVAGAIKVSDDQTGEIRHTGSVLCPVDFVSSYPFLHELFKEHPSCQPPVAMSKEEVLEEPEAFFAFSSRSGGLLTVTHPPKKRLSKLPINAWRLRVTFDEGHSLEFDVPCDNSDDRDRGGSVEHRVDKTALIQDWVEIERENIPVNPLPTPPPAADPVALQDSAKGDESKQNVLENNPSLARAPQAPAEAKKGQARPRPKPKGKTKIRPELDGGSLVDSDEDEEEKEPSVVDARVEEEKAVRAEDKHMYVSGGGRRKARQAKQAKETAEAKEPQFKSVVKSVTSLARMLEVCAVSAIGAGPWSRPVEIMKGVMPE